MVLAVRTPLIKRAVNDSRRTYLRVDDPADIILVKPTDKILSGTFWSTGKKLDALISRTADEWKNEGDIHFKAGHPFAAAVAYSRRLILDSSKYKARMNRSLCHIRLGNTQAASHDIDCLLDNRSITPVERTKSLLRKGIAHYSDMKYEDARTLLLECLELDPRCSEATQYLQQCLQRLKERDLAQYDWVKIFKKVMNSGIRLDVSDFCALCLMGNSYGHV
jgi:tetratricopeptide (TPR) repeat protein